MSTYTLIHKKTENKYHIDVNIAHITYDNQDRVLHCS